MAACFLPFDLGYLRRFFHTRSAEARRSARCLNQGSDVREESGSVGGSLDGIRALVAGGIDGGSDVVVGRGIGQGGIGVGQRHDEGGIDLDVRSTGRDAAIDVVTDHARSAG